ncbi:hypothetical protein C0993_005021 [Termitomyces sp. T159_Od127]|nr:hypothetical protein C0993_005021 [Termitomyces sp. T159_Od127]
MAGPIRHGGHKVTWALRDSDSTSSRPPHSSLAGCGDEREESSPSVSTQGSDNLYFTPGSNRLVDKSPFSMSDGTPRESEPTFERYTENVQSAPAELGAVHEKINRRALSARHSTDHHLLIPMVRNEPVPDDFKLDPTAPVRAMRSKRGDSPLEVVVEEAEKTGDDATSAKDGSRGQGTIEKREKRDDWGESFKLEWLSTEKISFQKTRHLRNPWNHNREVKVSRDGTELEPSVGRKLITDWALLATK